MSHSIRTGQVAVFSGVGQPLQIRDFELPELSDGEGLVEVLCCTLCRSDLHTISGKRETPTPTVLGHEILGRLIEAPRTLVDINGNQIRQGDRVSWSVIVSCNNCFFCSHGLPQKCERLQKYGHQTFDIRRPLSGGLASHCVLMENTQIAKVPDNLPDHVVGPANCATATIAAAWRIAESVPGASTAIIGAGMLGLSACAMARHAGAADIFVSDIDPHRAARAIQFGASQTGLNTVFESTDDRGVDIVLDTTGCPDAIEHALQYLRIGGELILAGAVYPARPLSIQAEQLVRRVLRISGIHNYTPIDLNTAMDFLAVAHSQYPFGELVEREYPLMEINAAVADALENNWIRVAIKP